MCRGEETAHIQDCGNTRSKNVQQNVQHCPGLASPTAPHCPGKSGSCIWYQWKLSWRTARQKESTALPSCILTPIVPKTHFKDEELTRSARSKADGRARCGQHTGRVKQKHRDKFKDNLVYLHNEFQDCTGRSCLKNKTTTTKKKANIIIINNNKAHA